METENLFFSLYDKRMAVDNFLIIPDDFKQAYTSNNEYYWIYGIYNIDNLDKPVYIGKTQNIRKRALQYYLNTRPHIYNKTEKHREIITCIFNNKLENFRMIPISYTDSNDLAIELELKYMDIYDTVNNGYNTLHKSLDYSKNDYSKTGKYIHPRPTAKGRRSISKILFMINPETKKGYICTGIKLAGEVLGGISKDIMKNIAERGLPRKGFFVYYLDSIDFKYAESNVKRKLERNIYNGPKEILKTSSLFNNYFELYSCYLKYGEYVKNYLKSRYNPEDIDIKYVTQSDETESGFIELDPDEFIDFYMSFKFKIYQDE